MKVYTTALSFMGLILFSAIDINLALPYAIIAGAYLLGEAFDNSKKR